MRPLALWWQKYESPHTRYNYAKAAQQVIRFLAEHYAAPTSLATLIGRSPVGRPCTTTWSDAQYEAMLTAASPRLRCYLLLCGVHAIRSGTAVKLCPRDYVDGKLSFRTKYGAIQTMGVTHDLDVLLRQCTIPDVPFVAQLPGGPGSRKLRAIQTAAMGWQFRKLRKALNLPSHLHLHDLRRTMARKVYRHSGDLRDTQNLLGHASLSSTVWYLQDEIDATPASLLDAARRKPLTERTQ